MKDSTYFYLAMLFNHCGKIVFAAVIIILVLVLGGCETEPKLRDVILGKSCGFLDKRVAPIKWDSYYNVVILNSFEKESIVDYRSLFDCREHSEY